jgi:gas vesicle protein
MSNNKSSGPWGFFTFMVGIIAGGVAALFLATDEKGATKKQVRSQVAKAKSKVKEVSDSERVKEIFGKSTAEAKRMYAVASSSLKTKVGEIKEQYEKIDKKRYTDAVSQVVAEFKKNNRTTSAELNKLKTYFLEDYERLAKPDKKSKKA